MLPQISSVLSAIPDHIPVAHISNWLRSDIFPKVLPQQHSFLLAWIDRRCRTLELTEKEAWPKNALGLISLASRIISTHANIEVIIPAQGSMTTAEFVDLLCGRPEYVNRLGEPIVSVVAELLALKSQLEDIQFIIDISGFHISLSSYVQSKPIDIASQLLNRVQAVEVVAKVIEDEVKPFLKRHRIECDSLLLQYMRDFLGSLRGSTSISGSAWEAKSLVVIECMSDVTNKIDALLELLRHVTFPVSDQIAAAVSVAETWQHPRVTELQEQFRLAKLKRILQPYSIKDFNLSDASKARGLMRQILARTDLPQSLNDALEIVQAYHHLTQHEAYVFWFQAMTFSGKLEMTKPVISSLEYNVKMSVCREVVEWACEIIGEKIILPTDKPEHVRAAEAAELCYQVIRFSQHDDDDGIQSRYVEIRSIKQLMVEFDIFMSRAHFRDLNYRELVFSTYVSTTLDVDPTKTKSAKPVSTSQTGLGPVILQKIDRIAKLLTIPHVIALGKVAQLCASGSSSEFKAAFSVVVCNNLLQSHPGPDSSRVVHGVVRALIKRIASQPESIAGSLISVFQLLQLTSKSIGSCSPAQITDILELARSCELAYYLSQQCTDAPAQSADLASENDAFAKFVATDKLLLQKSRHVNPETHVANAPHVNDDQITLPTFRWPTQSYFRDDHIVLQLDSALPPALSFSLIAIPAALNIKPLPYQQVRISGRRYQTVVKSSENASSSDFILETSGRTKVIVQHLMANHNSQLALRYAIEGLAICIQHNAVNSSLGPESAKSFQMISSRATQIISEITAASLVKALSAKALDRRWILGCFSIVSIQQGFTAFRESVSATKKDYSKLNELALVGVGFSIMWNQAVSLAECKQLRLTSQWSGRLTNLGVAFDRKSLEASLDQAILDLVPSIALKSKFDLALLKDLKGAFPALQSEIELKFVVSAFSSQADEQRSSVNSEALIGKLVNLVANKDLLSMLAGNVLQSTNPYDYEKISVILKHIASLEVIVGSDEENDLTSRGTLLLRYLQVYERALPASDYESEFNKSMKLGSNASNARHAHWSKRLPFHSILFGDAWKIISTELTRLNISKLLPLAKIVGIPQDGLIATAIEISFADDNALPEFDDVISLLDKISDEETSIMTAKLASDKYPLTKNRIRALEYAQAKCEKWMARLSLIERPDLTMRQMAEKV